MIQRNELRRKWSFSPFLGILTAWLLCPASPIGATAFNWDNHSGDSFWDTRINWNPYPNPLNVPGLFGDTVVFDGQLSGAGVGINTVNVSNSTIVDAMGVIDAAVVDMTIGDGTRSSRFNIEQTTSGNSLVVGNSVGDVAHFTLEGGWLETWNARISGKASFNIVGADSYWVSSYVLISGDQSTTTAQLNVLGRGEVVTHGNLDVGSDTGSGRAVVHTSGLGVDPSLWWVTGSVDVGPTATDVFNFGELYVQVDGKMIVEDSVDVHGTTNVDSKIIVRTGGQMEVGNLLQIGPYGALELHDPTSTIATGDIDNDGGSLNWTGGTLHITDGELKIDDSSVADLDIDHLTVDSGMTLKVTSTASPDMALRIGDTGTGSMTIQNGGLVESYHGTIGDNSGSDGTVNVTGNTSRWILTEDLIVGFVNSGVGRLSIAGGQVSANSIWLGAYHTADGTVTVNNGTLTSTAVLAVGGSITDDGVSGAAAGGTGRLTVQNGGTVDVASTLIVFGGGTVELTGSEIHTGSFINDQGGIFTHEDGTLTVDGGTFAPNTGGNYSIDSPDAIKLPTVKLTGGASYTSTGTLFVGNNHGGQVEIRSGSTVSTLNGRVGWLAGTSDGHVLVDGELSRWINTGDLEIGVRKLGSMTISNGGRVENTDGAIGAVVGSNGLVTVESGGTWNNSDWLYVGGKFSAGGVGNLRVHADGRVDATSGLKVYPDGVVRVLGGEVHVGAGGFWLDGGGVDGTGAIVMSGGGNVHNDGFVLPAPAPDPLVMTGGNYYQNPGGTLVIKIGGTEPFEYSRLEIDFGAAFLDGEVWIDPTGGFSTPSVGDRFDILAATGGFAGTEFATLIAPTLPDLAWGIDYGANVVSLGVFFDADFDHDGDVDGRDLLVWQRGAGMLNPKHKDGDADGDGDVDAADLARWKLRLGSIAPVVSAGMAVPEPASFVLALVATLGLGGFRRGGRLNAR